ncbi:DUF1304 domain-containing protein [Homoserinimonas sp. OAct 916]|uniref:DUF1304 domain-containing protein n=1 Tax=Homoserinimonas sp. OAct 916 TaxID=2211450 RepID=UPI000DBE4244|nr:DUF1304 domain-containing protein [Homoserinimonas sp. OAct 916]
MGIASLVIASLAAALHVGIFVMESVLWTRPAVWRLFGLRTQADAQTTRPFAYNQGFYNLFLAVGAAVGVGLVAAGGQGAASFGWVEYVSVQPGTNIESAGIALVIFTMGCMFAASVVLLTTGRGYLRAAVVQGALPLIALVLLLVAALV